MAGELPTVRSLHDQLTRHIIICEEQGRQNKEMLQELKDGHERISTSLTRLETHFGLMEPRSIVEHQGSGSKDGAFKLPLPFWALLGMVDGASAVGGLVWLMIPITPFILNTLYH